MGKKKKNLVAQEPVDQEEQLPVDSTEGLKRMLPEVADLADRFDLPDDLAWRLHNVMDDRIDEYGNSLFREDMRMLHERLDESWDPAVALVPLLKDLSSGRFISRAESHAEVQAFCKRHGLDRDATAKLTEAMHMRETRFGFNVSQDLKILGAHLENSNAPSKLVSMKLKDMRAGYKLGNCIYARAKDIAIAPDEGGPGIEGARGRRAPTGYTDRELSARFGATRHETSGVTMTEEQARQFQRRMREAQREEREDSGRHKDKERSRDRGRDRGRSLDRKSRSRSRRGRRQGA